MNKRPYLGNGLTDWRAICHCDTYLLWEPYRKLKIWMPKNPRWQTAAILITAQWLYLSHGSTCRQETWYDNTRWLYLSYRRLKFWVFRNSRWRRPLCLNSKIVISLHCPHDLFQIKNLLNRHLKLYLSNKTANIHGKNWPVYNQVYCNRVIALKRQKSLW